MPGDRETPAPTRTRKDTVSTTHTMRCRRTAGKRRGRGLYGTDEYYKKELSGGTERLHTALVTQLEVKVATSLRLLSSQPI